MYYIFDMQSLCINFDTGSYRICKLSVISVIVQLSSTFCTSHFHDRVQIFSNDASTHGNDSLCDRLTEASLIVKTGTQISDCNISAFEKLSFSESTFLYPWAKSALIVAINFPVFMPFPWHFKSFWNFPNQFQTSLTRENKFQDILSLTVARRLKYPGL